MNLNNIDLIIMHLDQSGCIKFSICILVGSSGIRTSEMTDSLDIVLGEG